MASIKSLAVLLDKYFYLGKNIQDTPKTKRLKVLVYCIGLNNFEANKTILFVYIHLLKLHIFVKG